MFSFLKASLGFLVGAALGVGLASLSIRLFCDKHPAPTQQIGDIGILVLYGLGALAVTVLLAVLGGIAGVVVIRRFW